MREEKLNFGIILRIGISLLPVLFGMPMPAMIWCSFNIVMAFVLYGPLTSFVSSLCAVCISMFFYGFYGEGAKVEGLLLALQAVLSAAGCIYTIARQKGFFQGVWLTAAGHLIPSFISIKHLASREGQSVAQYMLEAPLQNMKLQLDTVMQDPSVQMYAENIETSFDVIQNTAMLLLPSVFIMSSVIIGYVIMWFVSARLRTLPISINHSFSAIRIPKLMLVFFLVSFGMGTFAGGDAAVVATNVFAVFICFFFFAGISLVEFFLQKKVKSVILRIIIHLTIIMSLSSFVGFIFILLAITDSLFDFRKIKTRRKSCEAEE